jgi:hypothetical protein
MAPRPLPASAAAEVRRASEAQLPTSEIGSVLPERPFPSAMGVPGWSVIEAQQAMVPVPALRWPRSIRTYEDMRRDGQVQGLLTSVYLPIRHMDWYVDPNGTTGTMAQEIAEDFGLPILGEEAGDSEDSPGIQFDEHLRLALLALALGHQFFEESGVIEGEGSSMKYRLRKLSQRPQSTINRISVEPSGDLISIRQIGSLPAPEVSADRMLPYVWDREGANWAGRPLLYGIYRHWLLKDELIRGDAVMHRRFSGIPIIEQTAPGVVDQAAHESAAQAAQSLRAGDTSGLSTPYGLRLRLAGVEGALPNAIKSVEYHDAQMARAFMQMFAELGKVGSRALGTTLLDHYGQGVIAVAHWYRRSVMQLVRRIIIRNYGTDEQVPKITFRQEDHEDITGQELVGLIDSGAIVVDDDLEETIRSRANLPPRNAEQEGRVPLSQPGAPAPVVAPSASARKPRRRGRASASTSDPSAESQTDFEGLQSKYEEALATLTATWTGVQAGQITELEDQVANAASLADLAAVTPAVEGASALTSVLNDVLAHGAQTAVDEAAAQGATLPAPDLTDAEATLDGAAQAVATLLSRELGESAASKAVSLADGGLSNEEVAGQVRTHLEGLAGATPAYEIAGLVSRAQNEGRFTAMEGAPDATDFYASDVNDINVCDPCKAEDGDHFPTLAEARRDFPAGGFLGCLGGNRCRCTIVAIYAETPGQANS